MIDNFCRDSVRAVTRAAHDKYISKTYETQLLQIELAADNGRYVTTFDASECPMEFVTWLLLKNFFLYYEDNRSKEYRINQPCDYDERTARVVLVKW
jgi:hypothetical protein